MNIVRIFVRLPFVLLAIAIVHVTVSCQSGPSTTRYIVNRPDQMVGMEVTYRDGAPEYSHPAVLTTELISHALQHIEVQPSSLLDQITGASSTRHEAFPEKQRQDLAQHISHALQQATPLETITFYWTTPRGNGIWEITSGGMYLRENDLHLILPNYRQTVPSKNPPQTSRNQPLAQLGDPLHSLKALPPAQQHTYDLATELWSPQTPHFIIALNELPNVPPTSGNQQAETSMQLLNSEQSIKQRLKRLEKLHQEGLLLDNEYQDKRQEILDEL